MPQASRRSKFSIGPQVEDVAIADESATATLRDLDSGSVRRSTFRFVIGCDGARSVVRKAIGAKLHGDAVIQRVQSTFIRAPDLIGRQRHAPAWGTGVINPRRAGMVYAIDGRERWLVHNYLKADEPDFDSVDRDWAIRTILGVGCGFPLRADLEGGLVRPPADGGQVSRSVRLHRRRCGAHLGALCGLRHECRHRRCRQPVLAACGPSQRLGAAAILDAYEAERLPITEQVSRFAMTHAEAEIRRRGAVPDAIEDAGPEGERARAEVGNAAYAINVQQYACAGLNFGPYYDRSPIIAYDGAACPPYTMATYNASTVPGCRTPHLWLANGRVALRCPRP